MCFQGLFCGHVEEAQAIQREGNGHIVHEGQIKVGGGHGEVSLMIQPVVVQCQREQGCHWLHEDELEDTHFQASEKHRRHAYRPEVLQWP